MKRLRSDYLPSFMAIFWGAFASPVSALELEVVRAFSVAKVTSSPASIAVDSERDLLLLGGADGSVTEISRDGVLIGMVVTAGLLGGQVAAADRAIAVMPALELFYCAGGPRITGLHKYTRSGERLGTYGLFGAQSFQGLVFEPRDPIGVLHLLDRNASHIFSYTVNEAGSLGGKTYSYKMRLQYQEQRELTGLVLMAEQGSFIVSLQQAHLLLLPVENLSPRHGEMFWLEESDRIDLNPLGIRAVDDLAFDPVREHLYLTDSSQERVFELAFLPSAPFHRGDPDGNGDVSILDALHTFNFLFLAGPAPGCLESADTNNDGRIDLSDAVALLNFLFLDGPAPPTPGPPGFPCGVDPDRWDAVLGLGCEAYARC